MFIFYTNNSTAFHSHYDLDRFSCLHTTSQKCHTHYTGYCLSLSLLNSLSLSVSVPVYVCMLLYFTFSQCQWNCRTYHISNEKLKRTHALALFVFVCMRRVPKNLLWYARKLTKLMISLYTANGSIIQNSRRIYRHPRAVQLKSSFYDIAWFPLCIHFWKYPSFDSCHVAA